jgi:mRNA interferase RelE/StbE
MNRSPRRRTTFPRAEPMTRRRSGKHLAFLRRHARVSRRLGGRCAACARYQAPVAEPLVAFGGLVDDPRRRGKPLQRELGGRWAARRGDYRIVYRLDEDTKTMYVLKIGHRAHVYRGA